MKNVKDESFQPISREMIAGELAADLEKVTKALASLLSLAGPDVMEVQRLLHDEGEECDGGAAAKILVHLGLHEAFAVHCARLDFDGGVLAVLVSDFTEDVCLNSGIYRFAAALKSSGEVENLGCTFYRGVPLELKPGEFTPLTPGQCRVVGRDRLLEIQKVCRDYMNSWRGGWRSDLITPRTVVRHRLSPSQSFRKLLSERWCDPGLEPLRRFADNAADYENWKDFLGRAEGILRSVNEGLEPPSVL